jgi:hypothetical protein
MPLDATVDEQHRGTDPPPAPDAVKALEHGAPTPSIRMLAAAPATPRSTSADAYGHHRAPENLLPRLHATRSGWRPPRTLTQETFVRLLREAPQTIRLRNNLRAWRLPVRGQPT